MRAVRAVVFDLDDTLYSERSYVFSGFRAVAAWAEKKFGIPHDQSFDEFRHLLGSGRRGNTFDSWLESHKIEPVDWIPQMVRIYREHRPQIVPHPEVLQMLPYLRQHYRLGLLSDGYLQVQKKKLASLNIGSCFDAIVFSDELGPESWKPSSRCVLRKLAVAGQDAVYVADNPSKDFIGARQVDMWTARIRRPDGLYCHLEPPSAEHAPDEEINDLSCLKTLFIESGT